MPDVAINPTAEQGEDDASETLNQVGMLLSRPELWGEWLEGHPDRAELFKEIFSCVVRLRSQTGWSDDQLLESLGCDTKTEKELSGLTKEHLRTCLGYMLWVEDLISAHDMSLEKREILREAARFFATAKRDLERVKAIMERGPFSPDDYLNLGEIERSWQTAFTLLEESTGSDQIRQIGGEGRHGTDGTAHLSAKRLEMLAKPDAGQLLGPRVARRMREHIAECASCSRAADAAASKG